MKKTARSTKITDPEALIAIRLAKSINELHEEHLTRWDRWADKLSGFVGSWTFIITFIIVLVLWIATNSIQLLLRSPYDPYPFILLNLVLSCIAAIQAPVILMSQNREEARDRLRGEHDFQIDQKAEILIEDIILRLKQLEQNQQTALKKQEMVLQSLTAYTKNPKK